MGTISDFLGRKGAASTSAALPVSAPSKEPAPSKQPGTNGAPTDSPPTLADLGARIGEGNESLRNLLIDTERRIAALDDVRCAFRDLVDPIGIALQALEQEKTDNAGLRNVLAESGWRGHGLDFFVAAVGAGLALAGFRAVYAVFA